MDELKILERIQLENACYLHRVDEVKRFVQETDVIVDTEHPFFPIWIVIDGTIVNSDESIESGLEIIKFLLENGCKIDSVDHSGTTPLGFACHKGIPKYVEYFLKSGANPLHINPEGYSMFLVTIRMIAHRDGEEQKPFLEILKLIVNWCLKNREETQYYRLLELIFFNKIEEIEDFLNGCKDPDFKELKWDSPLFIAVHLNKIDVVQALVNRGANVNLTKNRSILHDACMKSDEVIVEYLLSQPGTDINAISQVDNCCDVIENLQRTPLMIACAFDETELVRKLLNLGVDVLKGTNDGYTALHIACAENSQSCVELLLRKMNPNIPSKDGVAPLHLACANADFEVIQKLLQFEVDLTVVTKSKQNALHYAASNLESTKPLKILLEKNVFDINFEDEKKQTALSVALKKECCQNFAVLILKGADIRFLNEEDCQQFIFNHQGKCQECPIMETLLKLELLAFRFTQNLIRFLPLDFCAKIWSDYKEELDSLKKITLNSNPKVTLYDFLLMNREKTSIYSKNKVLKDLFVECKKDFQNKFVHYGFLLSLKFREGLNRAMLMDKSFTTFDCLVGKGIARSCSENLFRYFNDGQLKEFIKVEEEL